MITDLELERMDNPLAEKMLSQRTEIRFQVGQVMKLEAALGASEQTVRNLQHELNMAHKRIYELMSGVN